MPRVECPIHGRHLPVFCSPDVNEALRQRRPLPPIVVCDELFLTDDERLVNRYYLSAEVAWKIGITGDCSFLFGENPSEVFNRPAISCFACVKDQLLAAGLELPPGYLDEEEGAP